jgi:hypothetical protein
MNVYLITIVMYMIFTLFVVPDQICWMCLASKGKRSLQHAFSDTRPTAGWRATLWASLPWDVESVLLQLVGFEVFMIMIDLMHAFHLGVGRDILGSALKTILRGKEFFNGSTIEKRMHAATMNMKKWAQDTKTSIRLKKLTKNNLTWKSDTYPELKCKAADTSAILSWLAHFFGQANVPAAFADIATCVWAADSWIRLLMSGGEFADAEQVQSALALGDVFLNRYVCLAKEAQDANRWFWYLRPKFHLLCHVQVYLAQTKSLRSIKGFACWMDEDMAKHVMKVKSKTHRLTSSEKTLLRYLEGLLLKLTELNRKLKLRA